MSEEDGGQDKSEDIRARVSPWMDLHFRATLYPSILLRISLPAQAVGFAEALAIVRSWNA